MASILGGCALVWRLTAATGFVLGRRYSDVLAEICRDAGVEAPRALLDQIDARRAAEKARSFAHVDPRIVQLLTGVRSRGIATAVISNASPEEYAAYPSSVLSSLVEAAVFSCEVGCAKPSAKIYEMACTHLSISPGEALFVGDGGADELEGAARVGMRPIWATWFSERWAHARGYELEIPTVDHTRTRLPSDVLTVIDRVSGRSEP